MEQITLYYRQGSSDKVYQAAIEPQNSGYIVTFAYGRRGTTLNTGIKTPTAVQYDAAKAIYDKLITEKQAKGYTPGEEGTPYRHTEKANQSTGIVPQLLNPIDESEVASFLNDPDYWMQEKHDGRRLLIHKHGSQIRGINKLGLEVGLPSHWVDQGNNCSLDFLMDGEAVGDQFHAFDLLRVDGEDIRAQRYIERHLRLMNLLASFQHRNLSLVHTAFEAKQKAEAFHRLREANREGVVFKHIEAPYIAGRPNSGGPQRKFKFCATASFIVGCGNAKRSVSLFLYAGKNLAKAGNVTIPPNHDVPTKNQIVECRYLYAFSESGCIYQPVYLGTREDVRPEECTVDQLKFKEVPSA